MAAKHEIRIEGCTPDEFLAALDEEAENLIFSGKPLAFRAGTVPGKGECYYRLTKVE